MAQVFQVLKCYKCGVFQVHQTKKSNKWECKLCNEKQSIKRHYGLGTGKECRLHVQKLNSIRGEVDHFNETKYETSDDEKPMNTSTIRPHKIESHHSRWLDFVDEKDNNKEPEPNKAMYIGDAEVVLEVPSKRRKMNKHKNVSVTNISREIIMSKVRRSPSPPPIIIYESQNANARNTKPKISKDYSIEENLIEKKKLKQEVENTFIPAKVDKNSKWAQYANEPDGNDCEVDPSLQFNDEDCEGTEVTLLKNEYPITCENSNNTLQKKIFSLCTDNDLDDVLDF